MRIHTTKNSPEPGARVLLPSIAEDLDRSSSLGAETLLAARLLGIIKIACIATLTFLASCATPSSSSTTSRAIVKVPDRYCSFWTETKMHPCYIAKETAVSSDSMMKIIVGGEVVNPGRFEVPEGTTILEAIVLAGGFTHFSAAYHLRLSMGDRKYSPALHVQKAPFHKGLAWYGDGGGDLVLQPGAQIHVPRH